MTILSQYGTALNALFVYLIILLIQWGVDTLAKGSQPGAVPGKMPSGLSHDSFVFRAHRTFHNTLENAPLWLGSVVLAILVGVDPVWVGTLGWLYVASRIAHMALYYLIATEKNPSPRSYFFLLGLFVNIALMVKTGIWLLQYA